MQLIVSETMIRGIFFAFCLIGFINDVAKLSKICYLLENFTAPKVVNVLERKVLISPSILSVQMERQLICTASFAESSPIASTHLKKKNKHKMSSFLPWPFFIPVTNRSASHWMKILLLKCMDVESNPGPLTRYGGNKPEPAAHEESAGVSTAPKPAPVQKNIFEDVKDCQLFGVRTVLGISVRHGALVCLRFWSLDYTCLSAIRLHASDKALAKIFRASYSRSKRHAIALAVPMRGPAECVFKVAMSRRATCHFLFCAARTSLNRQHIHTLQLKNY